MEKCCLVFIAALFCQTAFCQKEAFNWYFGNQAAINFSSGTPVALTNSAMNQSEGCATISDTSGSLLFYTSGVTVYNRNHTVMLNGNGLLGNTTSAQSSIIAKMPLSDSLYYIFTIPDWVVSGALRYSIVDMSLDNGNGAVTQKNIVLHPNAAEQVTSVLHGNCKDIWIVSHEKGTQNFLSYQLTDVGLVTTPVITAAGLNYFGNNRYGYLKFSSDGSLLCSTLGGTSTDTTVQLFSFDSQTGIVSNPIALAFNGQTTNAYSSEFSADMTKLYVVAFNGNFIDQYDITSGVRATIIASRIDVGGGGTVKSCVQMGPDGRIYVSRNGTTFLGAITQPDASGASCNYVDNAVNLGSGRANLGFPNFIQSYFRKFDIGNDTAICQGNTVVIDVTRAGATYLWQDGSTNPVYTITQTGSYNVFVLLYSCFLRDTIQVTAQPVPVVNLGSDTTLCAGQGLALNATTSGATYQWNDNSTMPTLQVNNSGTFAVTVTVNGCSATDNMVVAQSNTPPAFSLGNDTAYCNAFSATLSAGSAALWSTGVTAPQIAVNAAGTYWASVSSGCGTASDTIVITQATVPIVNLGNDTALCSGATLLLGAFNAGATYLWQDASTSATYNVLGAGIYAVTVTGQQGCTATDAINVSSANPPAPIQLGSDTTYCGSFTLTITTGNANTLWSTGTTASQINVNSFGTYWAAITNGCGTVSDTIVITQAVVPVVNLGNDTALCSGATLLLGAFNAGATYLWQDASTAASYNVAGAGSYTVTVTSQQGCTATDAINVNSANPPGPINLGNDTAYCGSFTRIITTGNANTVWSTGAIASQINVNAPGIYHAQVTNACGVAADTITISTIEPPPLNVFSDTSICNGDTLVLSALSSATNFSWNTGGTTADITVSSPGNYQVQAWSDPACKASATVNVVQNQGVPSFSLGPDTTICGAGELLLRVPLTDVNFVWQDNTTNSDYTATASGTYAVTVSNSCGTATDSIAITFLNDACALKVPTGFSPNGDGSNDLFRIFSSCAVPQLNVSVYNRWGELVFETDDIGSGWNGVVNNREQPLGVYVYYIYYTNTCSGNKELLTGNLTLVR